jgi:hypothetical protein
MNNDQYTMDNEQHLHCAERSAGASVNNALFESIQIV